MLKWIDGNYKDYQADITVFEEIDDPDTLKKELFNDDQTRVELYERWNDLHVQWRESQYVVAKTRELFYSLYQLYRDLDRDSESMELVVANGILRDSKNPSINHPVLTRRVVIDFDPTENLITISDCDVQSELYTLLLQKIKDINLSNLDLIKNELKENDYHPLDNGKIAPLLKSLVRSLSPNSLVSMDINPLEDWGKNNRLFLQLRPLYIFRKKVDGTPLFLQGVVDHINQNTDVPKHLEDVVCGGTAKVYTSKVDFSIEEQLAQVGGEDLNILLAKEANREQLEIVRRIDKYNAVLVQGPPGTGKTHTIANLIGHFLSQGKTLLVTSQTPKALHVLKEKLPKAIKPLCVSVLKDSNRDMEYSVDEISAFMATKSSAQIEREALSLKEQREKLIDKQAQIRRMIFDIMMAESSMLDFNGEQIPISKVAEFVCKNRDDLSSIIEGDIDWAAPFPFTPIELETLYKSNEVVLVDDEIELKCDLPSMKELKNPSELKSLFDLVKKELNTINSIKKDNGWTIKIENHDKLIFDLGRGEFVVPVSNSKDLTELVSLVHGKKIDPWMISAIVDSEKGGAYLDRWNLLVKQIQETYSDNEKVVSSSFGKEILFTDMMKAELFFNSYIRISDLLKSKGRISKFDLLKNREFKDALDLVTIDGKQIQSSDDCDAVINKLKLIKSRNHCAKYWRDLIGKVSGLQFFDLDKEEPEAIARQYIDQINWALSWTSSYFLELQKKLKTVGIYVTDLVELNQEDSDTTKIEKILNCIENVLPFILSSCVSGSKINEAFADVDELKDILAKGLRRTSKICNQLHNAVCKENFASYEANYKILSELLEKKELLVEREKLLARLESIAPKWSADIKNRIGIHGSATVPNNIEKAWKFKQFEHYISRMLSTSYEDLQKQSISLAKDYRARTSDYAAKLSWFHLLKRTEENIDMKQAINGWKLTVKKIGKGTGKSAAKNRAKARELMSKCQSAVPAWIMPMSKVIETLSPAENKFDVVIVDEASQSDICAIGLLYLAKKLIIVGDDKQVSPLGIGVSENAIEEIARDTIKNVIPNSHLYGANSSLYDIAATTYQPLMLREHFRCVPKIIGFSNVLSYDCKIKPLRDSSSTNLFPPLVNYQVKKGKREDKHNKEEAMMIVALMKACMEQSEYEGKSFGVISMLADEQVKWIYKYIYTYIAPHEIEERNILCGKAADFQGDERDVIFLSIVDSSDEDGPLPLKEFGPGEIYRKRYNVAASRAKDQLWVVNSLNIDSDLKANDIRRRLIEYAMNPFINEELINEVEVKSESPFELAVAKDLIVKGYNIVQQWEVGAYRIDMVAVYEDKHVAIECDGELYHSGEDKIKEDMERQTILERSGWNFIRIRGSEYYSNPFKTIERVCRQLHDLKIEPFIVNNVSKNSSNDLLDRVKKRALEIRESFKGKEQNCLPAVEFVHSA